MGKTSCLWPIPKVYVKRELPELQLTPWARTWDHDYTHTTEPLRDERERLRNRFREGQRN